MKTRLIAAALILAAGCSSRDKNACRIRGTVTFDGKPLIKAYVEFFPVDPNNKNALKSPVAGVLTDANGRYDITTKERGEHKIAICESKDLAHEMAAAGFKKYPPAKGVKPLPFGAMIRRSAYLPPIYSDARVTRFSVDLQPGERTMDFNLSGTPEKK